MSTSSTTTSLTFPHPALTPIPNKPTNKTLQLLQQDLYANARAIQSTRGGGENEHLAMVMHEELFFARTGYAFLAPVHPGNNPVHAPGATQHQITETNRQYAANLVEHTPRYNMYGEITPEELERNRALLSADWNPDEPMECFWFMIKEVQRYANAGAKPISDAAIIRLTLIVFEKTVVFATAVEKWCNLDEDNWTMPKYQAHFQKANKERIRKLTALNAGYHGAHAAIAPPASPNASPIAAAAIAPVTPLPPTPTTIADGQQNYNCWTHGLGTNKKHTSSTCERPKPQWW